MLADDVRKLEEEKPTYGNCTVGQIIKQYSGDDLVALTHLIDKSQVSTPRIVGLLEKHGHKVSPARVQYHRRRITKPSSEHCSCPVEA